MQYGTARMLDFNIIYFSLICRTIEVELIATDFFPASLQLFKYSLTIYLKLQITAKDLHCKNQIEKKNIEISVVFLVLLVHY